MNPRAGTLSTHWDIHLNANTDEILTSIQRPGSLTPGDGSKPLTDPHRSVIKPHSTSADVNEHDTGCLSVIVLVGPTSDATSSTAVPGFTTAITHRDSPTQRGANIPRTLEAYQTGDQGGTSARNHRIQRTAPPSVCPT